METSVLYHAAAYLRLSREDGTESGRAESDSIRSQRQLIRSYLQDRKEIKLTETFVDDGYSGADFERPAFRRMMERVTSGEINCIIVKDLSRLGRDYIEAGRLIQKTFPAFSVRFIAVTDHFDSLTADEQTKSLVLPIRNFINDAYCRDISQKVKSAKRARCEQGRFVGAFAVYGYRKDPADKNHLVPDAYAAAVVRRIFAWKLDGMSSRAIAEQLNAAGILSPFAYKKLTGEHFSSGFCTEAVSGWSAVAVRRILGNEVYTGTLVQCRSEKVNHKIRKVVEKPKEAWVRREHTHEAVVSAADYAAVQKLLRMDTRAAHGEKQTHPFAGFLFCGDCGAAMIRRVVRYRGKARVHFICAKANRGGACTRHSISWEELEKVVRQTLQFIIALFDEREGTEREMAQIRAEKTAQETGHCRAESIQAEPMRSKQIILQEFSALASEQERFHILLAELDEDWKAGVLGEEEYQNFRRIYEQQYAYLCDAAQKQQTEPTQQRGLTFSDRAALITFLDRIEVYEKKRIVIRLNWNLTEL